MRLLAIIACAALAFTATADDERKAAWVYVYKFADGSTHVENWTLREIVCSGTVGGSPKGGVVRDMQCADFDDSPLCTFLHPSEPADKPTFHVVQMAKHTADAGTSPRAEREADCQSRARATGKTCAVDWWPSPPECVCHR